MKGSKEFFEELRHNEEWCNCFMTKEIYNGIYFELKEQIVLNEVRQKNKELEQDENYINLVKKVSKAKKELRNYEFDKNHK